MSATGYYTFQEAAKLASYGLPAGNAISARRLRGWFRGTAARPSLIADATYTDHSALSFLALVDATVGLRLLQSGLSPRALHAVREQAAEMLNTPFPFARDGIHVSSSGEVHIHLGDQLIDIPRRQLVFVEIMLPFLKRIDYADHQAVRWRIAQGITLDPALRGGSPVEVSSGIPAGMLAAAAFAEGAPDAPNFDRAAWLYSVEVSAVRDAVRFEQAIARGALRQ